MEPSAHRVTARWLIASDSFWVVPKGGKRAEGKFRTAMTLIARAKMGPDAFDRAYPDLDSAARELQLESGGLPIDGQLLDWLYGSSDGWMRGDPKIKEKRAIERAQNLQGQEGMPPLAVVRNHWSGTRSRGHASHDLIMVWPTRDKVPRQKYEFDILNGKVNVAVGAKHVFVSGDTYPVKGKLSRLEFWWDASQAVWRISRRNYTEWLENKLKAL